MYFALVQTFSVEFEQTKKFQEVFELSNRLELFFSIKDYGTAIKSYVIGITCVSPGFDPFFSARKPKYIEDRKVDPNGLYPTRIVKAFEFSVKLDYDFFYNSDKEQGLKYIAQEIMTTVRSLKYPKKVIDFDRKRFESDLEFFFIEQGLL